jgi:hypothetical protein
MAMTVSHREVGTAVGKDGELSLAACDPLCP